MRVLAAMSGGVDSAVAAARAVEAGHDVVGVHLALSTAPGALRTGSRGCCSREDADDARRAADVLGIPFYVWDFADRFKDDVIDEFVEAYAAGQTPNPCLTCNEKIKFAALAEKAIALGFDALATGHYAQLTDGELRRAVDADKDQSYVLAVLTREQLDRAMFPIGDTPKTRIREEAARRGLSVANKPDSHDICFIPTGDTRAFLGARIGIRPGAVVDADTGERLADHEGVHGFTIGQRKGLGIEAPAADGRPRYVTDIDPESGTVRVGSEEHLQVWSIRASRAVWTSGQTPDGPFECIVQVRAHGGMAPALATPIDDADGPGIEISLAEPLTGVARGQAAVLYLPDAQRGDLVLGSGRISVTSSTRPADTHSVPAR
ncbi:tRNA 2-thiouridine(34) synthase MnmA [Gordonia sp. VNK1]|uniref:tRNA 2-thiouridine(34) synthase MnmA n=1 Tax=Gordonia oleivorans TaxID=3156618 RepID=UPI0032B3697B